MASTGRDPAALDTASPRSSPIGTVCPLACVSLPAAGTLRGLARWEVGASAQRPRRTALPRAQTAGPRKSAAIDLHIHSHASDGEASADHIAEVARQRHLRLIAIADHDEGRESMRLAASAPDIAVAAIELTCRGLGGYADLLGIGLRDPTQLAAYWTFGTINAMRLQLWRQRLGELGWDLADFDRPGETRASWVISGQVFASTESRQRAAALGMQTEAQFRSLMLSKGTAGHIDGAILDLAVPVEEGIAAILRAGGVPVLAHPGLGPLAFPGFDEAIDELVESGLEGLEVVHPAHDAATERRLSAAAETRGLLVSVGSDTHDGDERIGRLASRADLDVARILASWIDRLGR